jgi:hypothetical protein
MKQYAIIVEGLLAAAFVLLAVSGFQMEEALEHNAGPGQWMDIHETTFFAFSALLAFHIVPRARGLIRRLTASK